VSRKIKQNKTLMQKKTHRDTFRDSSKLQNLNNYIKKD